jgi:general L-amino acid transport system substrate-binding protein
MNRRVPAFTIAVHATMITLPARADTLQEVRDKGYLDCGVAPGAAGFSAQDADGKWTGLEVDYCRAMAAAIFDDPDAVRFTPLSTSERFDALTSGVVDVLSRTTTWTMGRDTQLGINFAGVMFYDAQGFMVRADDGYASALELGGARICIESDTTTELNAADFFAANSLEFNPVLFGAQAEVVKAYEDGRCDAYSSDTSALASERQRLADPDAHIILPEIISKEPLGPAVRQGDEKWFSIARWTYFALLDAEELGVNQLNVDDMLVSDSPAVKRLLGVDADFGSPIGLTPDWAFRIIKHVGNYGEIYERHVGLQTPIGIARGINELWTRGGIQYAPPIR